MPMKPYVIVLAKNTQEAATYVKRARLPRGRWRIAASAGSIRGLRRADVHKLPGFDKRPDRFAILTELRYARCNFIDVEMPPRPIEKVVDQGDGMGQQLTIDDAILEISDHTEVIEDMIKPADDNGITDAVEHRVEGNDEAMNSIAKFAHDDSTPFGDAVEAEDVIPHLNAGPGDLIDLESPAAKKAPARKPRQRAVKTVTPKPGLFD